MVILNSLEQPELAFTIISEGEVLLEEEPFKIQIEGKIMNDYFDFQFGLRKYNLTRA